MYAGAMLCVPKLHQTLYRAGLGDEQRISLMGWNDRDEMAIKLEG
jgi:hypothetical protein